MLLLLISYWFYDVWNDSGNQIHCHTASCSCAEPLSDIFHDSLWKVCNQPSWFEHSLNSFIGSNRQFHNRFPIIWHIWGRSSNCPSVRHIVNQETTWTIVNYNPPMPYNIKRTFLWPWIDRCWMYLIEQIWHTLRHRIIIIFNVIIPNNK